MTNTIHCGDSLEVLKQYPDNHFHSIVCDPPYGLGKEPDPVKVMQAWCAGEAHHVKGGGFMGKEWDAFVPQPQLWAEVFRVLRPGGYAAVFAGTRTQDWMTMSMRFAGFRKVDVAMWVFGSGFPKSHSIEKSIDHTLGYEPTVTGTQKLTGTARIKGGAGKTVESVASMYEYAEVRDTSNITEPTSEEAKQFRGYGTNLKPAYEPILLMQKPISEKTIALNCLKWGCGGINIDDCRVGDEKVLQYKVERIDGGKGHGAGAVGQKQRQTGAVTETSGRWPANFLHDGSPEVLDLFPETKPNRKNMQSDHRSVPFTQAGSGKSGGTSGRRDPSNSHDDNGGSAARFFYCAKVSKSERNAGLESLGVHAPVRQGFQGEHKNTFSQNSHPTVKPIALMQHLVGLVTPKGGIVLDPFMGSGSTGVACTKLGFDFVGVEMQPEYVEIAEARIKHALNTP
jgi:DNA modification methylase